MTKEEYLSLAEVKELLKKEKSSREELMPEQKLALQHAEGFTKLSPTKSKQLVKQLMKIEQMTEQNAFKIADVLPEHSNDVRAIFSKERFTLSKEDVEKVLALVRKYL
ncbi:MAG: RNA polymerase [Methanobacteriota archaeon]|nr:MAG: RNA polymerase [Euryarchaeota archaeon]